jgi:uncharacterized membrane protein
MKIKHFQGYGTVDAKKVSRRVRNDGLIELVVQVIGNHEYGIVRNDTYDVFRWLVKRFEKTADNYRQIKEMNIDEKTVTWNGQPTDCAIYSFVLDLNT